MFVGEKKPLNCLRWGGSEVTSQKTRAVCRSGGLMSYMLVNALEKISALNEHEILSKAFPLKAIQLNNFHGESGLKRFSIRFSALFSFLYCFSYCCRFFLYLFPEILEHCQKEISYGEV